MLFWVTSGCRYNVTPYPAAFSSSLIQEVIAAVVDDVSFYPLQRRAVNLNAEVDQGIRTWRAEKEEQERAREQLRSSMLKPKGKMLLKSKNK